MSTASTAVGSLERITAEQSIAAVIRTSTMTEHRSAEERPFIVELMRGDLSLADYTRYLAQFGWVYAALESRQPVPHDLPLFDPRLARRASIDHDLAALGVTNWREQHPALPATREYVARLLGIASDDTVRRVAHHYTRYLGDLSGGQAIARLVGRNYGATPDQLTFFDFEELGDVVPYKRAYREQLDALQLSPIGLEALVAEVKRAYALNGAVFDELAELIMHVYTSALQGQLGGMLTQIGPVLFYLVVWGLVFVGTALLVGLFIPFVTGDTLLFASGIIAASGSGINIGVLAIGTGLAAFAGDQVGYAAGRRFGRPYLDKRGGRRTQALVARTDSFYRLYGWWSVVVGRFIPWGRVFIPIIAGAARMRFLRFATANLVGTLAWGVGITVIGYFAASSPQVKELSYVIAVVCIVASLAAGFRAWLLDRRARSVGGQVSGDGDDQKHSGQKDVHGQVDVPFDRTA